MCNLRVRIDGPDRASDVGLPGRVQLVPAVSPVGRISGGGGRFMRSAASQRYCSRRACRN